MKHRQFNRLTSLMFCLCAFIVPATTATARDLQVATLIANDAKDANNQEAAESKAVFELTVMALFSALSGPICLFSLTDP